MPDTVLVTGSTGFIGSALCRALLAEGVPVRALHRQSSPRDALHGLAVERTVGDILDPESLTEAFAGIDLVFHTAAQAAYWRHPAEVLPAAIEGTGNVVRAALNSGVRRLVLTSSIAAMGVPAGSELLTENHRFNLPPARFPYGYAKDQAERQALQLAGDQLELITVNPCAVLGPGDLNQIGGSLVLEAARGRAIAWLPGGMNFVHLEDVVAGHLAAARQGLHGQRYLLCGENLSYRQALSVLCSIVGRHPPRFGIPPKLLSPLAAVTDLLGRFLPLPLNGDQLRLSGYFLYCDGRQTRRALGLGDPLPFRQAATEAYDWYRKQQMLPG